MHKYTGSYIVAQFLPGAPRNNGKRGFVIDFGSYKLGKRALPMGGRWTATARGALPLAWNFSATARLGKRYIVQRKEQRVMSV